MSKNTEGFDKTSSDIARGSKLDKGTVTLYADLALVPSIRLSNGTRLFRASAVAEVRAIYAKRMGNRGRRSAIA